MSGTRDMTLAEYVGVLRTPHQAEQDYMDLLAKVSALESELTHLRSEIAELKKPVGEEEIEHFLAHLDDAHAFIMETSPGARTAQGESANLIRRLQRERGEAREKALTEVTAIAKRVAFENRRQGLGNIHGFADADDGARHAAELIESEIRALQHKPEKTIESS